MHAAPFILCICIILHRPFDGSADSAGFSDGYRVFEPSPLWGDAPMVQASDLGYVTRFKICNISLLPRHIFVTFLCL